MDIEPVGLLIMGVGYRKWSKRNSGVWDLAVGLMVVS